MANKNKENWDRCEHGAPAHIKCHHCDIEDNSQAPQQINPKGQSELTGSISVVGLTAKEVQECIKHKYFIRDTRTGDNDTTLTLVDGTEVVIYNEK